MGDLLFIVHDGLPREAPGSAPSTRRALANVRNLAPQARVLDVGCGPGQQTIDLAVTLERQIVALDLHAPYLVELRRRARAANVAGWIHTIRATMAQMPFADETFDVIWSEGAIYLVGFERGLRAWRALLRPGGYLGASELCWLVDDPPQTPRDFWATHYPAMTTVDRNLATAAACGYDVIDSFELPASAWWNDYYDPLEHRLTVLRRDAAPADRAVLDGMQQEVDLYRRYSTAYGYVFFVLRRSGSGAAV